MAPQCNAATKAGARCRKRTNAPSGRCNVHTQANSVFKDDVDEDLGFVHYMPPPQPPQSQPSRPHSAATHDSPAARVNGGPHGTLQLSSPVPGLAHAHPHREQRLLFPDVTPVPSFSEYEQMAALQPSSPPASLQLPMPAIPTYRPVAEQIATTGGPGGGGGDDNDDVALPGIWTGSAPLQRSSRRASHVPTPPTFRHPLPIPNHATVEHIDTNDADVPPSAGPLQLLSPSASPKEHHSKPTSPIYHHHDHHSRKDAFSGLLALMGQGGGSGGVYMRDETTTGGIDVAALPGALASSAPLQLLSPSSPPNDHGLPAPPTHHHHLSPVPRPANYEPITAAAAAAAGPSADEDELYHIQPLQPVPVWATKPKPAQDNNSINALTEHIIQTIDQMFRVHSPKEHSSSSSISNGEIDCRRRSAVDAVKALSAVLRSEAGG
ncbi:hypothetical protein BKA81DRAFT_437261 [Phyllosticta paracitricarpa]|uniref:Uncharacterized protein n=1 Tax=Phyllosticta paracitricarpa TaxID=2016321 RepID=A0ABR1MSH1_9PEZI